MAKLPRVLTGSTSKKAQPTEFPPKLPLERLDLLDIFCLGHTHSKSKASACSWLAKTEHQQILVFLSLYFRFFPLPPVLLIEASSTTINISKSGIIASKGYLGCYTLHLGNM